MANINVVPAVPGVVQPRSVVKVCGAVMAGVVSWEVDSNTFYQADTFRLLIAIDAPGALDAAWFAGLNADTPVEIYAGFPSNPSAFNEGDLELLLSGVASAVDFNPTDRTIELTGSDLTEKLANTKTSEKWPNKTASDIATDIAKRHGLTPVVTATTTKAGRFYEIDHVRMTDERSEWDLLTWLAHEEQFAVYVKGNALHFEPRPTPGDDSYLLLWEPPDDSRGSPRFNGKTLNLTRSLSLSRDIIVTVRSWNAKAAKGFSRTVRATKTGVKSKSSAPQTGSPDAQLYSYTIPGLTPEEALQKALSILADLSQHEMRLTMTGPADNLLTTRTPIELRGTGTAWDQLYYPESIIRRMSMADGYSWTVQAKNSSPETEITL